MADYKVILVEPLYGGNIGSVARVMKNFGFTSLVLVGAPRINADARKKSMHALDVLRAAKRVKSFVAAKKLCDFTVATSAIVAGDKNPMRTPVFPAQLAASLDAEGTVGLVFGREDNGLSNAEIEACDMLVTIPANPEYPTLNLAQSVGVLLYEISRQQLEEKINSMNKFRKLNAKEKEHLQKNFDLLAQKVLREEFRQKIAGKTFKQVVGRSFISGREATTLIGVLRKAREGIRK